MALRASDIDALLGPPAATSRPRGLRASDIDALIGAPQTTNRRGNRNAETSEEAVKASDPRAEQNSRWVDAGMDDYTRTREGVDRLNAEATAAGIPLGRAVRWKRQQLERQASDGTLAAPDRAPVSMADVGAVDPQWQADRDRRASVGMGPESSATRDLSTRETNGDPSFIAERAAIINLAAQLQGGQTATWPNTGDDSDDAELAAALDVVEAYRKQVAPEVPGPRFMRQLLPRGVAQAAPQNPDGSWGAAGESMLQGVRQAGAGVAQFAGERLEAAGRYLPALRPLADAARINELEDFGREQGTEALWRQQELGAQLAPEPTGSVYEDPDGWARYVGQQGVASSGLTLAGMAAGAANPILGAAAFLGGAGGAEYGRARIEDRATPSEAALRGLTSAATEGIPEALGGAAMLGRLPLMKALQSTARGRAAVAGPVEAATERLTETFNIAAERARGEIVTPEEESKRLRDATLIGGLMGTGIGGGSASIESAARGVQNIHETLRQADSAAGADGGINFDARINANLRQQQEQRARGTTARILGNATPETAAGAQIADDAFAQARSDIQEQGDLESQLDQLTTSQEVDRLLTGGINAQAQAGTGRDALDRQDAGRADVQVPGLGGSLPAGVRASYPGDQGVAGGTVGSTGAGSFSGSNALRPQQYTELADGSIFVPGDPVLMRQRLADAGVKVGGVIREMGGMPGVRFAKDAWTEVQPVVASAPTLPRMQEASEPAAQPLPEQSAPAARDLTARRTYGDTTFDERVHDLADFIALNGGLDRSALEAEGIDPANWNSRKAKAQNDKFFGKPLFRKSGGMTLETLRERARDAGFRTDRDVLDLLGDSLGGRKTFTPAGSEYQLALADLAEQTAVEEARQRRIGALPPSVPESEADAFIASRDTELDAAPDRDVADLSEIESTLASVADTSPQQRASTQSLGADYTSRLLTLKKDRRAWGLNPQQEQEYQDLLELDRETGKAGGRPMVGVRNKTAYADALDAGELLPVQGFTDADDFKSLNDKLGHAAGDEAIRKIGEVLASEFGDGNVFHRSGDEFLFQGADQAEVDAKMQRVRDRLSQITLRATDASGNIQEQRGIGLSYGTGTDEAIADAALVADKQRRKQSGQRVGERRTTDRRGMGAEPAGEGLRAGEDRSGEEGVGDDANRISSDVAGAPATDGTKPVRVRRDGDADRGNQPDISRSVAAAAAELTRTLGAKFARRLTSQPWFNLVESIDQIPENIRKTLTATDSIGGFVTPDGQVFVVTSQVGDNLTGVVLHEVGVHFGMSGDPEFGAIKARFKRLRSKDPRVAEAYASAERAAERDENGELTQDAIDTMDEEALAYFVEQNWSTQHPLIVRIKDALRRVLNRLGVPMSMMASDEGQARIAADDMLQMAIGAARAAADGAISVRDGKIVYSQSLPSVNRAGNDRPQNLSGLAGVRARPESGMPTPAGEKLSDVTRRNANKLSDLLVTDSGVVKSLGELSIPARRDVLTVMRGLVQDFKILNSVVGLIPVDVVNVLAGQELAPDALLDEPAMLVDLLPVNADDLVPGNIPAMDKLAGYVARSAAKVFPGLGRLDSLARNGASATRTVQGNNSAGDQRNIQYRTNIGNELDDSQVEVKAKYSRRADGGSEVPESQKLVALHNISPEGLLFADKIGGLAVPSIGITKAATPFTGFGSVTLIGSRDLATPSGDNPVFSADAFTQRFPDVEWPAVSYQKANAFLASIDPDFRRHDTDELHDHMVNHPDRDKAIDDGRKSATFMKAWLAEVGDTPAQDVTEKREPPHRARWAARPAWSDAVGRLAASGVDVRNLREGSPEWAELDKAARAAIEQEADLYADLGQSIADEMREDMLAFFGGSLSLGDGDRAIRFAMAKDEAPRVDRYATKKALQDQIGDRMPEFSAWVAAKIAPLFGEPSIRIGRKKVPMTLDNIVEAMTSKSVAGKESTMTFGTGKAKAMNAKRYRTLEEVQADRAKIVSTEAEKGAVDASDKLIEQYRDAVLPYTSEIYNDRIDTWAALDASMKALADAGKKAATAANMRSALARNGFRGVDADTVQLGVDALIALRETVTDYFEAKPQRAVKLSEFAGAVVKASEADQVRPVLEKHGVEVREYSGEDAERRTVIDEFTKELEAKRGSIRFSRKVPRTAEQEAALTKAGMPEDRRTLAQRGKDYLAAQWDALRNIGDGNSVQRALDKFHRMSAIEQELGVPVERSAYVSARLAAGLPSIMEGVMMYGAPKWENGVLTQHAGTVGLLEALQPVADDINGWLGWMVGRRAKALKAQGRENLMTQTDIDALLSLSKGREQEFEDAALKYLRIKRAILNVAESAGLIDPVSRAAWDSVEYIPFYRTDEESDRTIGPGTRKGLEGQSSGIKQLKGGTQNLADPLGNIIRNFTKLIDASLKNNAVLEAVDNYGATFFEKVPMDGEFAKVPMSQVKKTLLERGVPQNIIDQMPQGTMEGLAKMWSIKPPTDDDVVRVMRGGKPEYYRVPDKDLLLSLTSFKTPATHWAILPFKFTKQLLTAGVTSSPEFMARNFVRDSASSWVISDDKFALGWDSVKGVISPLLDDTSKKEMMFAGGSFVGGQFFNVGSDEQTANAIRRSLRAKGLSSKDIETFLGTIASSPITVWDKWQKMGSYLENANRNAIYENALKAGRSKKEAAYMARDLMDFSLHGDSRFVQVLSDVLPFFNARLQGLYKLYRQGGKKALRKHLLIRAGGIVATTAALMAWNMLMYSDGYDELEEWDKDTYWHIAPGTKYHIRIPKPFELGVLFATIPERVMRAVAYQVTDGETGDRPKQTLDSMLAQLSGTLAMNPIPQGVMPIVEQWANKSFFTGRPIENLGDQNLLPEARSEWYTSDTARVISDVIGNKTGLSPKRIEHLWNGYTGTMGAYSLDVVDWLVRSIEGSPERPELAWAEMPLTKAFYRGDTTPKNTRYVTDFYELSKLADQASGTVKEYEVQGKSEKAKAEEAKYAWLLGKRVTSKQAKAGFMHTNVKEINKAAAQMSELRKKIQGVAVMPGFTDVQKRERIEKLTAERNAIAKKITVALRRTGTPNTRN